MEHMTSALLQQIDRGERISLKWFLKGPNGRQHLHNDAWYNVVHEADRMLTKEICESSFRAQKSFDTTFRIVTSDTSSRWVRSRAFLRHDSERDSDEWIGFVDDVHDDQMLLNALHECEQNLDLALSTGCFGTWEFRPHADLITGSGLFMEHLGYSNDEISYENFVLSAIPEDRDRLNTEVANALLFNSGFDMECRFLGDEESFRWVRLAAQVATYAEDDQPQLIGLSCDITKKKVTENADRLSAAKLTYEAYHDPLTGVGNRRLLREDLVKGLRALSNNGMLALVCLDLNNFKAINDVFGHPSGDIVLIHVAAIIRNAVDQTATVARYGGDEFAVLLPGLNSIKDIEATVVKILRNISETYRLEGRAINIGASFGITVAPRDSVDPDRLMKNADAALYRAKNTMIEKLCFFEHEMDKTHLERAELTLGLPIAVESGQMMIFYQPLISLKTGRINCVEALLRWDHPKLGQIGPSDFIPIAEDTGQINWLGQWALRQACLQAKQWPDTIKVAVNLSVSQIVAGDLASDVEKILGETALNPKRLELEVTESLLLSETTAIAATLKRLRAMGICIAMDDFGTGYSSLTYLHQFNFEKIKIDKSLVSYFSNDNGGDAIASAAILLGRNLGIAVTAEGVETQRQLDQVRYFGCTQAQGFLFSGAIPAAEVEEILDRVWF